VKKTGKTVGHDYDANCKNMLSKLDKSRIYSDVQADESLTIVSVPPAGCSCHLDSLKKTV